MNEFDRLREGFLLDSGPLLVYAFAAYNDGKYLGRVRANIPAPDLTSVARLVEKLSDFSRNVITTPHILTEFHALARVRVGLRGKGFQAFLSYCSDILGRMEEIYIAKKDLYEIRGLLVGTFQTTELCFADVSALLASSRKRVPLVTLDRPLKTFARRLGIEVFHIYDDIFLQWT